MTFKLLKDLNFAEKLNAHEAVTESGKDFLKNYRGYMFQNAATCSIVNNFIKEAKAYAYDKGLMNILESVVNFVNENNILQINDLANKALRDISQNANGKIVFFDMALQMIVLLIQKK